MKSEILEKDWLSAKDITCLVPVSIREARSIVKGIVNEMKEDGAYVLNTKTMYAPTELVAKKLHLRKGKYGY